MRHFYHVVMLATAVSALISTTVMGASFEIIGADQQFQPSALSTDGQTLVGVGLAPDDTTKIGMTWTQAGGLSYMSSPGAFPYSIPTAISADGSVIAGYNQTASNVRTAWYWTATGGYQTINIPGFDYDSATSISADGNVIVGEAAEYNDSTSSRVFMWTAANGASLLPYTSNGNRPFDNALISADGQSVIGVAFEPGSNNTFLWTSTGGSQDIPPVAGVTANNIPAAITADGSTIIGTASDSSTPGVVFRYSNGVTTSLGAPTPLAPNNDGIGVSGASADGSVIVGGQSIGGRPYNDVPWVWTPATGFVNLSDVLAADGIDTGSYQISNITGISADGNILYGDGLVDGIQPSGWIVYLPEPSGSLLLLPIAAAMLCRRTRLDVSRA